MQIAVASLAFALAALCAAAMGYAIQRGATCTVAAVEELVVERRCLRLLALVEAALWVAGGLVAARALHVLPTLPAGHAVAGATVVGGALLGLGASLNGACVLGAIARFGSGQWAYLLTPFGFYLGCLGVVVVRGAETPSPLAQPAPLAQASAWVALAFAGFVVWRIGRSLRRDGSGSAPRWHRRIAARIWTPHAATTVIGITFVALVVLVGGWAYTDVLADVARGMAQTVVARAALAAALLSGAVLGGWTAGLLRSTPIEPAQALRCLVGGALMGCGSVLIPGGNDALLLVGMPLGWPYAWLAFATMFVTVAIVQLAVRRVPA